MPKHGNDRGFSKGRAPNSELRMTVRSIIIIIARMVDGRLGERGESTPSKWYRTSIRTLEISESVGGRGPQ